MIDGILTSFFLPTRDYEALSDSVKNTLDQQYLITVDKVIASTASRKYWSPIWDDLESCVITDNGLVPDNNLVFDETLSYTILRPRALLDEIFNQNAIIIRCMNSPLITINFYDGSNPIALGDRQSVIDRSHLRGFEVTKKRVTYELEDLEPIQLDYVNELFTVVWQQIYDEQEENYDEADFNRGRPPINGLISQFVVAVTLERHNDDCFLTFDYELYDRPVRKAPVEGKNQVNEGEEKLMVLDKGELPAEIEIMAAIPLAEDDDIELSPDDMQHITIDDNGDHAVQFCISLRSK